MTLGFGIGFGLGPALPLARLLCASALTLLLVACGGRPASSTLAASSAAPAASAAPAIAEADLAALRRWIDPPASGAPAPTSSQVDAALACLSHPDPELRDGVGFEVFARWLVAARVLDDAEVRRVRGLLLAGLAPIPAGERDAVFGRSFSALVLSLVAARELAQPGWSEAELEEQVAAAVRYAASETDLRGHVPVRGWAHAAAHTADWIKMLGRHPLLTPAQAERLATALAELVVRRHGYALYHGEEDRVAAALRSLIDRGALPDPALDRFLARLAEPLRAGWPSPFDPVLFAAQRNARALLYALFTSLSLARADQAPAAAALARLRALLLS